MINDSTVEPVEKPKQSVFIEVDKKKITLDEPIRAVGTSIVTVKLHKEVTAKLTVRVREA